MRLIVLAASLATISALRLSVAKAAPAQVGKARHGRALAQSAFGESTGDQKDSPNPNPSPSPNPSPRPNPSPSSSPSPNPNPHPHPRRSCSGPRGSLSRPS